MADATDLHALAVSFLDVCVDALDTLLALGLAGAPTRRFVSPGLPALDCCDQLAVHVEAVRESDTTPAGALTTGRRLTLGRVSEATLVATITRCVPSDHSPSAVLLDAAAAQTNADAWVLWNGVVHAVRGGHFLTGCSSVTFDGATAMVPSGGCGGWTFRITPVLEGYRGD